MATMRQEEDRLVATAQRIIKSLGTSKDVTDDMLLILSSFDNRLSNISKLIGCSPTSATIANDIVAAEMSRLEKVILRRVRSCSHLFDINSSVNESCEFLAAIDQILDLLADSTVKDNAQVIRRAESVIQSAMSKLEDELQQILTRSAIPLDLDNLRGSMHRVTLSFVSQDDDLIDKEFGSFNNQSFHEKGGSIVCDVSLNLVNPDVISDLREIAARMIRGGYEKEYSHVYSSGRRDVLEEYLGNLGFERLSIEEVHRIEWSYLDEKMKRWVQALKILVRVILTEEKRLCDQIIDGSKSNLIRDVCFVEATKGCIMQFLNFGEAVAIAKRSPEKLFRILDMYEALSGTLPYLEILFCNGLGDCVYSEAKEGLDSLGGAAKRTLLEFDNAVKNEASRRPVIGGGIHPLARYVMNYVKLIVDYSDTLNFLLEKETENQAQDSSVEYYVDGDELGEKYSSLGHNLRSLINSLESNLEEKAKYYDNRGMQYIFLMNNKLYMVQKVKDSELGELLGDDWIKRQRGIIRKCSTNYLRASWTKVLACLKDEGIGSVLSNTLKMSVKERFKNFNACFEEVYRTQTAWKGT